MIQTSPWPATSSLSALLMTSGLAAWFSDFGGLCMLLGLLSILLTMYQWWRDVVRELGNLNCDSSSITSGMRFGMVLFIVSEIMFFVSFFWAFFHSSLSPTPEIGCVWPPMGITPLNPFAVPLLNTAILLASGVTVTWAHHALMEDKNNEAHDALALTIGLGTIFTLLQMYEYKQAPFTIADGIYGTTFFVSTGFHGLHVLIGTTFLSVILFRNIYMQLSASRHLGFEFAAWYWHFVDVVWICLFISIYWWGS